MSVLSRITNWLTPKPKPPLPPPGPPADEPGTVRDWTVLVYGAGNEPDIDHEVWSSIKSLGNIGTNSKVALVAQVARHSQGGKGQRLTFGEPREANDQNFRVEQELGQVNTGDGQTLEDFMRWGIEKYPARHYLVVLNGHGGASLGAYSDDLSGDHLTHQELRKAFQGASQAAGQPIDVLVHSTCALACAEAVHAVQDNVKYVVASEAISVARNPNLWSLASKLKYRVGQAETTPRQAVELIFQSMERITAESLTHAPSMRELNPKIKQLADRLVETATPPETIKKVMERSINFGGQLSNMEAPPPGFRQIRDLVSLAQNLASAPEISDPDLKRAAQQVAQSVRGPVVKGGSTDQLLRGAQGMSIWAPTNRSDPKRLEDYAQTPFAQETGWDRVARKFGA